MVFFLQFVLLIYFIIFFFLEFVSNSRNTEKVFLKTVIIIVRRSKYYLKLFICLFNTSLKILAGLWVRTLDRRSRPFAPIKLLSCNKYLFFISFIFIFIILFIKYEQLFIKINYNKKRI